MTLRGISLELAQHWIELNTMEPTARHSVTHMNSNYLAIVKQDLDKLATSFIKHPYP